MRNLYIGNPQRTLSRKIREACLSEKLFQREQHRYGKNARKQILSSYLNEVFYGRHAYGAQAAARTYFSKDAADLTLVQAALLAGLPQAPTVFDPDHQPARRSGSPERSPAGDVEERLHQRGEAAERDEEEARAQARASLLAAERAQLLRLGDDAACESLPRETGRARRLQGDDDSRHPPTRACPARREHCPAELDGSGGRHRLHRSPDRCREDDGRLPAESPTHAVQLRDAGPPLDGQRLQADHFGDCAERRRLALLDLLRAA